MRKATWVFAGILTGLWLVAALPARAADGVGLVASPDQRSSSWSSWQGRISYGSNASDGLGAPSWRSGLGGFESGGFSVKRPGSVNSLSLMGDFYFSRSLALPNSAGGFRATSGLIIAPRSQLSVGQPGLGAGSQFSVSSRVFGQSSLPYASDAVNDTATVPYFGLGYTGLSARSGWSFSADLGMLGQNYGGAASRLFGSGQHVIDDNAHDSRLLTPLVQLGVLYSF